MLRELGLSFHHEPTPFQDGSTRRPEFLTLNPNGRVPVLVDGGFAIFESLAINLYLAAKYGGLLATATLQESALATQWSFWVVTEVEKPLLLASANRRLFAESERDEAQAGMAIGKLDRPFQVLDAHLADRRWQRFCERHRRCLARPAASDWKGVRFSIPRPPTTLGLLKMFV